jgi:divalent metal cation (Fe/Co/Zn/Cd) transporter
LEDKCFSGQACLAIKLQRISSSLRPWLAGRGVEDRQSLAFTGSVALLADLIHNFGDAATAIPLGIAFLIRSERAKRIAGYFVVFAIFFSAVFAAYEAVVRLIDPQGVNHLAALAAAGLIGYAGNWIAAVVRTNAGQPCSRQPRLVADGNHARADAHVSLAVVASAAAVALGFQFADPLISVLIMRITWQSWRTVRDGHAHSH